MLIVGGYRENIRESAAVVSEIGDAITKVNFGLEIDEDEVAKDLEDLEQEILDNKIIGAPVVPVSQVGSGGKKHGIFILELGANSKAEKGKAAVQESKEEDDEEAELRKLQAEMMMS